MGWWWGCLPPNSATHAHKICETNALQASIDTSGLDCEAVIDGVGVQIDRFRSYVPDALVICGQRIDDAENVTNDPINVVVVLSPSTKSKDFG